MKRFALLTLVPAAALLLIGGACQKAPKAITNSSTSTTTNTATTTNSTTTGAFTTNQSTVTISAAGMQPSTVTVPNGTTVVFLNSDSVTHEIAADPHPSHTDLPGFDGLIAIGGTYSFTFSQTGSFGYHDHLDPFSSKWKGMVVVQ